MPLEAIRTVLAGFAWDVSTIDLITMMAFVFNDFPPYQASREEVDWLEVIYDGAPRHLATTKRDTLLKLRLLITDDFIQGLFVYHTISKLIGSAGLKDMYVGVREYCDTVNLNFRSIVNFLKLREEYIEAFINANVDPFHGKSLYEQPPEEFMDTLIRVKYCIYDGFRLNTAIYDEDSHQYKYKNIPIETPPLLSNSEYNHAKEQRYGITRAMVPKKIMFSRLNIALDRTNKKIPIYKIKTPFISAVDGFINVDNQFL